MVQPNIKTDESRINYLQTTLKGSRNIKNDLTLKGSSFKPYTYAEISSKTPHVHSGNQKKDFSTQIDVETHTNADLEAK